MRARWLMGYTVAKKENPGGWRSSADPKRPTANTVLHRMDLEYFKGEIAALGAKTILEFGPGDSTEFFVSQGLHVTTIEHMQKWYEVAVERFKDNPNVRVLKGEDEMPFVVPELKADEKFDLAFVDAPQGYFPIRKIHKGYEDCSRFNTALLALQHAPVVLVHDCNRPLERGTLNRLNRLGYKIDMVYVPYGMARITNGDQSRFDLPRTA